MLRNALLWASTNSFLSRRLPRMGFFRRATRRFMPGEELQDALREAERLAGQGMATTVTLLGENLGSAGEADEVVEHYLGVLETVRERGLDTEISVKLTQLGIDFSRDAARERLERLCRACDGQRLVWVDMESSPYVDATLDVFAAVREDHENVGLCLQAYLRRTADDLARLLPLRPALRLVKGAYREPADVAFPRKADVDRNYIELARALLEARREDRVGRPVIGTHDPRMVDGAIDLARKLGLDDDAYEIAMLYGIQTSQQTRLVEAGHRVRVLISYGTAWFPWYMRRLAERPANIWFVLRQIRG